jgi:2'-5' RNA ligase
MMRLFIAIDMDEAVLEHAAAMQKTLRKAVTLRSGEVKWVHPEQMHLTLKFLGPVEDDDVSRVCAAVQETANHYDAFELTCRSVGVFGHPARVVWAGIDGGPILKQMQHELDDRFTRAGWAAENRAFTAHLTLCRIKSASAGFALAAAIEPYSETLFGNVWVDSIVVYESRLSAAGPAYYVVSRSPLR